MGTNATTAPVDERLPNGRLAALGLQHVLVMYAGAVAVPLIVGRALNLTSEEVSILIAADLFVCGIVSIIQSMGFTQYFGIKLPVMMGVTFASVGPMVAIGAANPGTEGARLIFGAIIVASVLGFHMGCSGHAWFFQYPCVSVQPGSGAGGGKSKSSVTKRWVPWALAGTAATTMPNRSPRNARRSLAVRMCINLRVPGARSRPDAARGTPEAAFSYEQTLAPGDSLVVVQLIGTGRQREVEAVRRRATATWREGVAAYEQGIRDYVRRKGRFDVADTTLRQTYRLAKALLRADRHYLDGHVVPMPSPAEYNFFFTHDLLVNVLRHDAFVAGDVSTDFFDRHGNSALVLGRFVAFVRTFITVVAGATRMERRRFWVWSFVGAVAWVISITALGYFLGTRFEALGDNIDLAMLLIMAVFAIPLFIEWRRSRRDDRAPVAGSVDEVR